MKSHTSSGAEAILVSPHMQLLVELYVGAAAQVNSRGMVAPGRGPGRPRKDASGVAAQPQSPGRQLLSRLDLEGWRKTSRRPPRPLDRLGTQGPETRIRYLRAFSGKLVDYQSGDLVLLSVAGEGTYLWTEWYDVTEYKGDAFKAFRPTRAGLALTYHKPWRLQQSDTSCVSLLKSVPDVRLEGWGPLEGFSPSKVPLLKRVKALSGKLRRDNRFPNKYLFEWRLPLTRLGMEEYCYEIGIPFGQLVNPRTGKAAQEDVLTAIFDHFHDRAQGELAKYPGSCFLPFTSALAVSVSRILSRAYRASPSLLEGFSLDCAVLRTPSRGWVLRLALEAPDGPLKRLSFVEVLELRQQGSSALEEAVSTFAPLRAGGSSQAGLRRHFVPTDLESRTIRESLSEAPLDRQELEQDFLVRRLHKPAISKEVVIGEPDKDRQFADACWELAWRIKDSLETAWQWKPKKARFSRHPFISSPNISAERRGQFRQHLFRMTGLEEFGSVVELADRVVKESDNLSFFLGARGTVGPYRANNAPKKIGIFLYPDYSWYWTIEAFPAFFRGKATGVRGAIGGWVPNREGGYWNGSQAEYLMEASKRIDKEWRQLVSAAQDGEEREARAVIEELCASIFHLLMKRMVKNEDTT